MNIYETFLSGKSCVFILLSWQQILRNDNFRLWILVSTHSEIVETGYFPQYSPIVIFAEYFVSFLDKIEYRQLLRAFTSVGN